MGCAASRSLETTRNSSQPRTQTSSTEKAEKNRKIKDTNHERDDNNHSTKSRKEKHRKRSEPGPSGVRHGHGDDQPKEGALSKLGFLKWKEGKDGKSNPDHKQKRKEDARSKKR